MLHRSRPTEHTIQNLISDTSEVLIPLKFWYSCDKTDGFTSQKIVTLACGKIHHSRVRIYSVENRTNIDKPFNAVTFNPTSHNPTLY
jgi:hypothetical protein